MIAPRPTGAVLLCLSMTALTAVVTATMAPASVALATEEPDTTVTSVVDQDALEGSQGPTPAITIPLPVADDTPVDWTYRYLVPTLLALAVIVVISTTIQYFTRVVRKRYKVVE